MSIMTEDQVKLLHKLQMAEIPAFKNINPLTLQEDEARDLFRMNLPPLEWTMRQRKMKNMNSSRSVLSAFPRTTAVSR